MARKQRREEVASQPGRRRWHVYEVEERVQSEHDEDEAEQRAGDDGGDFHIFIFGWVQVVCSIQMRTKVCSFGKRTLGAAAYLSVGKR